MSSDRARVSLVIAGTLVLAACNTANSRIGDEDPRFGESVKYNQAIQTVNPDPVHASGAAEPGGSGERGEAAVKRYRSDAVRPVDTYQSTSGSAASGATPH